MKILNNIITISSLVGICAAGCMPQDEGGDIDQQQLAAFRAALPTEAQLEASRPEPSAMAALGDPALYPTASWEIVVGINGSVRGIVTVMRTIVNLPPTVYNSETREFFWGPFPNDNGFGYVAAYIREAEPNDDFKYHYALLRGVDNDVANLTPVIWGGANPDAQNPDHGAGVTMWDFEANYEFEQAHNPDAASLTLDRGRFVAMYGKGVDENDPDNEIALVLATFRNFVPKDDPTAEPADLDYFYGRYITPDFQADFLDYELGLDVSQPADGVREDVGVRMAFLNEGAGRAEAYATGGSLTATQSATAVECWDDTLGETYLHFELTDGANTIPVETGLVSDCGLFQSSLDEMKIPSLDDVDPTLRAALEQVALTGVPAE